MDVFGFKVEFAKTEVLVEEEVFVYGFVSFVSEFGGSLGLFLGWSFMTVWDLADALLEKIRKKD